MDLPHELLERIADYATVTEHEKGDLIFRIGDSDELHSYLLWGQVRLEATDNKYSSLNHNQGAARFALSKLKPRRFSAKAAVSGTRILWIDSDLVEDCVSEFRDSQPEESQDTIVLSSTAWSF